MQARRPYTPARRVIAATLMIGYLAACTTWKPTGVAPQPYVTQKQPEHVRVLHRSGHYIELFNPVIRQDSLVGHIGRVSRRSERPPAEYAVPLADIVRVEVQRAHIGNSVLLVGAGITLIAVIGALAADDPPPPPSAGGGLGLGSCPLVYSWDGTDYHLDSGTFGGAITRGLLRTDLDNLDYAVAFDGAVRLRLANELPETEYVDELTLLAVEHDPNVAVAPDPNGGIHTIGRMITPIAARDDRGRDALAHVSVKDDWSWESAPSNRDPSRDADIRDGLDLVFPKPVGVESARLVVDANNTPWATHLIYEFIRAHGNETQAWYDSLDAYPVAAQRTMSGIARESFLSVQVAEASGWQPQALVWEAGPEVMKRQVVELDLSRVPGDTVRVRLESAPSFWLVDRVAIDYTTERHVIVHEATLERAVDDQGVSRLLELSTIDDRFYVMETGDQAELVFRVPEPAAGRTMSYLLRSTGWYRIHTPETGEPERALLSRIATEPLALSRIATARLTETLEALDGGR